jgi:hypothetical protein
VDWNDIEKEIEKKIIKTASNPDNWGMTEGFA